MEYAIVNLEEKDISSLNTIKPDTWASITEVHQHYLHSKSAECVKAVSNSGEILGIGTALIFNTTGWLAHIIVAPEHQNRGIGTAIVQNRISTLQKTHNCWRVTLTATDQGYPVYKKAGFRDESKYVILNKPKEKLILEAADKNICHIEIEHLEQVFNIDREVSGEERCEFLTPVVNRGFVYVKNRVVLGFYIPDFGDDGVSALTEEAGIALLNERSKEDKNIYIPEENEIGLKHLRSIGYTEVKRIHRMILGNSFPRKPQYCYSRIGGFAG